MKRGHCNVLEPLIYTFLKSIWLMFFLCVYRFHSKSISLFNWCYRLSIHRGQMKSILNAIRQGEHDHFLQLMYELIIGTPYLDIQSFVRFWRKFTVMYRDCTVFTEWRSIACVNWVCGCCCDTFVLWVNKRIELNWIELNIICIHSHSRSMVAQFRKWRSVS